MEEREKIKNILLSQIPRILGFGDRLDTSQTYGCFDRYYWHYKLVDFPCGWFQNVCYLLSLLYNNNFSGNIYFQNKKILQWAKASIDFALKSVNRDGSLSEVYPYERSFCITSFFAYYCSEALLACKLPVEKNLFKIADWLEKNDNEELPNQMAAAAMALYNIYLISKKAKYKVASEEKIKQILNKEDKTETFFEYGGLDIGYLSITLGILAKYYSKTKKQAIYSCCKKSLEVIDKKIDAFGLFDYEQTSRKTQYLFPYGFLFFKHDIFNRIIRGIEHDKIINPAWLDDRYAMPLTIDYLETYLELENAVKSD